MPEKKSVRNVSIVFSLNQGQTGKPTMSLGEMIQKLRELGYTPEQTDVEFAGAEAIPAERLTLIGAESGVHVVEGNDVAALEVGHGLRPRPPLNTVLPTSDGHVAMGSLPLDYLRQEEWQVKHVPMTGTSKLHTTTLEVYPTFRPFERPGVIPAPDLAEKAAPSFVELMRGIDEDYREVVTAMEEIEGSNDECFGDLGELANARIAKIEELRQDELYDKLFKDLEELLTSRLMKSSDKEDVVLNEGETAELRERERFLQTQRDEEAGARRDLENDSEEQTEIETEKDVSINSHQTDESERSVVLSKSLTDTESSDLTITSTITDSVDAETSEVHRSIIQSNEGSIDDHNSHPSDSTAETSQSILENTSFSVNSQPGKSHSSNGDRDIAIADVVSDTDLSSSNSNDQDATGPLGDVFVLHLSPSDITESSDACSSSSLSSLVDSPSFPTNHHRSLAAIDQEYAHYFDQAQNSVDKDLVDDSLEAMDTREEVLNDLCVEEPFNASFHNLVARLDAADWPLEASLEREADDFRVILQRLYGRQLPLTDEILAVIDPTFGELLSDRDLESGWLRREMIEELCADDEYQSLFDDARGLVNSDGQVINDDQLTKLQNELQSREERITEAAEDALLHEAMKLLHLRYGELSDAVDVISSSKSQDSCFDQLALQCELIGELRNDEHYDALFREGLRLVEEDPDEYAERIDQIRSELGACEADLLEQAQRFADMEALYVIDPEYRNACEKREAASTDSRIQQFEDAATVRADEIDSLRQDLIYNELYENLVAKFENLDLGTNETPCVLSLDAIQGLREREKQLKQQAPTEEEILSELDQKYRELYDACEHTNDDDGGDGVITKRAALNQRSDELDELCSHEPYKDLFDSARDLLTSYPTPRDIPEQAQATVRHLCEQMSEIEEGLRKEPSDTLPQPIFSPVHAAGISELDAGVQAVEGINCTPSVTCSTYFVDFSGLNSALEGMDIAISDPTLLETLREDLCELLGFEIQTTEFIN